MMRRSRRRRSRQGENERSQMMAHYSASLKMIPRNGRLNRMMKSVNEVILVMRGRCLLESVAADRGTHRRYRPGRLHSRPRIDS